MRKIKKSIAALLTLIILSSFMTVSITADTLYINIPSTKEEQIQVILDNPLLTQEQKDFHIARFELFDFAGDLWSDDILSLPIQVQNMLEMTSISAMAGRDPILAVRHFPQLTDFWCGPATAQQTTNFFNPSLAFTQRYIADRMGTTAAGSDMAQITRFVNQNIAGHHYIYRRVTNASIIFNNLISALNWNVPPVIRIETPANINWPYRITSGHFVNVTGVQLDPWGGAVSFRITDPWCSSPAGRWQTPNRNGMFWVSPADLFGAMNTGFSWHNNLAW